MGEIVINEEIANRLNEDTTEEVTAENIYSKAAEVAIEEGGLGHMFKPQHEWEIPETAPIEEQKKTVKNTNPVLGNKTSIVGPALEKVKRNRVQKTATSVKATSVQESIAKLQEKVVMLQYVDSIKVPDVPTGMSKEGRETLLQVGKDVEAMKGRLIAAIQKS